MEYYELLGLPPEASPSDIKKAYFTMLRRFPPEKDPAQFQKIRQAYEVLGNEESRRQYDQTFLLPTDLRFLYEKGLAHYEKEQYEQAISYLETLVRVDQRLQFVNSLLGDCYLYNGNSGKALKLYKELADADGTNAAYAGKLAKAYDDRGYNRKAVRQYEKALALDCDNISLLVDMADCLLNSDRTEDALSYIHRAERLAEEKNLFFADLYDAAMNAYLGKQDFEEAKRCLQRLAGQLKSEPEPSEELVDRILSIYMKVSICNARFDSDVLDASPLALYLVPYLSKESPIYKKLMEDLFVLMERTKKLDPLLQDLLLYGIEGCDCDECQSSEFHMKTAMLQSLGKYRRELTHLAAKFPVFYNLYKDFFDMIVAPDRRKDAFMHVKADYLRLKKEIPDLMVIDGEDQSLGFELFIDSDSFGETYVRPMPKVSRNAPCPCGSGKKYKHCCGK